MDNYDRLQHLPNNVAKAFRKCYTIVHKRLLMRGGLLGVSKYGTSFAEHLQDTKQEVIQKHSALMNEVISNLPEHLLCRYET